LKSITARAAGYCLDCFEPVEEINSESDSSYGWLESVRQMYDETDEYER